MARHGNPDEAIARYLEELRQANVQGAAPPAASLNGLGDAYLDKGDLDSAVDHYRQSAEAYAREGMYDNAIACCKKIQRYAPADEESGLLLGRYYGAKGLRADAARELESYADRKDRAGRRKDAILALAELVKIAPDRTLVREKLARLYAENGQRDAAVEEYRAARHAYESRGDQDAARRVADILAEQGDRAEPLPPSREERRSLAETPESLGADDDVSLDGPPPIPLGLEIEHTSYADSTETYSDASPDTAEKADAVRSGRAGPTGYAEMVANAERAASEGDVERAASWLIEAGEGLRSQRRWEEAVDAFRKLAAFGKARDDHYGAWTEAARQTGMASLVLEALSAQARWHVEAGRRSSARKAAEEMLLVDPKNDLAAEILSQVGSTLPRD
ncbi:MAG TPA: tetratricopeptide repeat protein [Gemmatimonadota bacterium]|nr:tetratricopeptide repeat protein [Gemmatimonadota bacterium]